MCEAMGVLLSSMVIHRYSDSFLLVLHTDERVRQVSPCHFSEALPVGASLGPNFPAIVCKARDADLLRLGPSVRLRGERVDENAISIEVVLEPVEVIHRIEVFLIDVPEVVDAHAVSGSQLVRDLSSADGKVDIDHPILHVGVGLFGMKKPLCVFGFWRDHSIVFVENRTTESVPKLEV